MALRPPLPTFRALPALACPPEHPLWVRPALFIALALGLLLRWHDVGGGTTARFRLVAAAGGSFARLADTGTDFAGYPLDAVLMLPLTWLAGSWPAVAGALWLAAAGAAMAWLVSAWWGSALAGTLAGTAWILALGPTLALADTATACALTLVPLAWGFTLRALERGPLDLLSAVGLSGACFIVSAPESRSLLLLFAATAGVAARGPEARRHLAILVGVVAGGVLIAAPALALRAEAAVPVPSGVNLLKPWLVALAALALWPARKQGVKLLLPLCALLAGLGPVRGTAAAAIGLLCIAAGGVTPLLQLTTRLATRRRGGGNT
ncbi:hypothetical protein LBMAG42_15940 [Deltaproteobacteria bacterium]|nr:hypothetical protein LBMAG42_15940 [Deltaproteobacteria bacterium]